MKRKLALVIAGILAWVLMNYPSILSFKGPLWMFIEKITWWIK